MIDFRELSKHARIYARLGLEVTPSENGAQAYAECPFCMTSHFAIKNDNGMFICGKCKESGNTLEFVRKMYEASETRNEKTLALAEARGIQPATFEWLGMKASMLNGEPMIPLYNKDGKIINLLTLKPVETSKGKKDRWMGIEGFPTSLIGLQHLSPEIKNVWLVEGPWKTAHWQEVLWNVKAIGGGKYDFADDPKRSVGTNSLTLGVMGVRGYSDRWSELLGDRRVVIAYDNDEPKNHEGNVYSSGWEWSQRTAVKIAGTQKRILCWGKGGHDPLLADGYDLGDLRKDQGDVAAYGYVGKRLVAPPHRAASAEIEAGVEPLECDNFEDLCTHFSEAIYFPKVVRNGLAIFLATILSTEARDDHLWFRAIGPPGSGKSTLASACSGALEYVYPLSKVKGFHSGFVMPGKRNQDNSLWPLLHGKCAIWKDADTLIQAPNRDEIMSELRDAYDSTANASYRHGVHNNYDGLRMTFILCGTPILRDLNQTMHGERFLDYEIFEEGNTMPYVKRARENAIDELRATFGPERDESENPRFADRLKMYTYGYLKYLKTNKRVLPWPTMSKRTEDRITGMAMFLSFARARPPEQKRGKEQTYKARQEVATRLTKQLIRLAYCLAFVMNKTVIDFEIEDLVMKVMYDTSESYHFNLMRELLTQSDDGLTRNQLSARLGISDTQLDRITHDLFHFHTIHRDDRPNPHAIGGRHIHVWKPAQKMRVLWEGIHVRD